MSALATRDKALARALADGVAADLDKRPTDNFVRLGGTTVEGPSMEGVAAALLEMKEMFSRQTPVNNLDVKPLVAVFESLETTLEGFVRSASDREGALAEWLKAFSAVQAAAVASVQAVIVKMREEQVELIRAMDLRDAKAAERMENLVETLVTALRESGKAKERVATIEEPGRPTVTVTMK